MPQEMLEENLLRSIEEVDARIQAFRKRVRALLVDIQSRERQTSQPKALPESN